MDAASFSRISLSIHFFFFFFFFFFFVVVVVVCQLRSGQYFPIILYGNCGNILENTKGA